MSIFISSGEASGDHYTANLTRSLRALGYGGDIWGMAGVESRDAGVRAEWCGERLQLLGLTEVLSSVPSILKLRDEMVSRVLETSPDAVVVCDSPDYHMRLVSKLRSRGYLGRVFYISPPSVWAWRSARADALREHSYECLPLFRFEHEYLLSRGCRSRWVGHPLVEEFEREPARGLGREDFDGPGVVAFLPGSRRSEIKALLPIMKEVAAKLSGRGLKPLFSVAPGLNPTVRDAMTEEFQKDGTPFYGGPGRDLMAAASCAVGASGTITVESLILGCYMVVTYKLNALSALVARCVIKTRYYAMANILAREEMFPELLQGNATPENIYARVMEWIDASDDAKRKKKEIMERTKSTLGERGAYDFWSGCVLEAIG